MHQMDVQNAFLHDNLDEEIYMRIPQGYGHITHNIKQPVCRLNKFLYGLKQASRVWFHKLSTTLKLLNFTQCKSDYSLFIRKNNMSTLLILAYVDDLPITGNNLQEIIQTKKELHDQFNITELGELRYFLGLEIAKTKDGLHIGQHKYALDILAAAHLTDSKPVNTPWTLNKNLNALTVTLFLPLHVTILKSHLTIPNTTEAWSENWYTWPWRDQI